MTPPLYWIGAAKKALANCKKSIMDDGMSRSEMRRGENNGYEEMLVKTSAVWMMREASGT